MFTLSIAVGRAQPMVWTLMFRTQKAADEAVTTLRDSVGTVSLTDEFGQTFDGAKADIVGSLFEDFEQSKLAHVERTLQVEKIKAACMTRMRSDPAFATLAAASPAMLSPMLNGGRMS